MTKALFAFSGDPITYGHMDIIKRAASLFDLLVVGHAVNRDKAYMFTVEEKMDMTERALARIPNIEVVAYTGLTSGYAYEHCIDVVIKGVRSLADFEYEKRQDDAIKCEEVGVELMTMYSNAELGKISSGFVKDILSEQGLIHKLVPFYVKQCLEAKMMGQYVLGVTGESGVGKSYVSDKFVELGVKRGIPVINLDLDHIVHQIYETRKEERYEVVRQEIADTFGPRVRKGDGSIDRSSLGDIVFRDLKQMDKLNKLMARPLLERVQQEMYRKKGLILINAALLADLDMLYLCNNNAVLVYADKADQEARLIKKGLNHEQIERRLKSQHDFDKKKRKIEEAIEEQDNGKIWMLNNSDGIDEIEKVFDSVVAELRVK